MRSEPYEWKGACPIPLNRGVEHPQTLEQLSLTPDREIRVWLKSKPVSNMTSAIAKGF